MFVNKALLPILILASVNAHAYMPSAPSNNNGYDRVKTMEGTECQSQVGGALQVYAGAYSNDADGGYDYDHGGNQHGYNSDHGVHVGITYSFGGGERLDCSKLYNIEVERAQLQLEKLKSEIEEMKKLKRLEMMEDTIIIE